MQGKLDGVMFCLSGPIDNALDDGVIFRRDLMSSLAKGGVNAVYYDPTNKPTGGTSEIGEEKARNFALRQSGDFQALQVNVKKFVKQDLRAVDLCDCLICYVDPDIHMCGTYAEVFTAERQRKPMMLIVKGGLTRCPLWLFGVFQLEDMFNTVEDCVDKLIKIDRGEAHMDNRWILYRTLLRDTVDNKESHGN